jgi:two-component system, sensor histidine kinase and response regulator
MGIYDAMTTEPTPKTNHKPTLLIVDDEAGPRESLRMVFKDRYNCAIATCGNEGINFAQNNRVDAAILDIKMPDISGVDVLRSLKELDPNIECVMLTGYETIETARAAVRYGAADYLNKPFDVPSVRQLMEKCMARRQRRVAAEETLNTLRKVNEELAHSLAASNRAMTASVLSAGVVHEINNPLSIIAGYAYLLSKELTEVGSGDAELTQSVQLRLATIQREVERCKDIAQRFLTLARTKQRVVESIPVSKLLEDAAALVKVHPSNVSTEIVVKPCESTLTIEVHAAEFLQVLINLCVNALQAMEGNGRLTLAGERIENVTADCGFRAPKFDAARPHAKISVSDTGCGVSPENIQHIFEPFFTTKTKGNGLGLAIVTELIGNYHGGIAVQSVVGQGTTFNVYLPLPA